MRPVKIITDSCSDLTKELREKYDIDYVRMNVTLEGSEMVASLDWDFMTPDKFYQAMREGTRFRTTQVPVAEFSRAFKEYVEAGYDIVYIGCSSKQSGSVNTGNVVARDFIEKYPEAHIFCIDSLNACMGEGILAIRAAMYRDKGLDAQSITDRIMSERNIINEFCTVHSLEYLKNAGRVKASAAFFGNLLGVKPILIADRNGYQTPLKKVKGRQASIQELVKLMKDAITDPEEQTIYIMHADCIEEAKKLEAMVKEAIPCKDTYISYIGPIVGASIGPDAIALWAVGKEVTFSAEN